MKKLFKTLTVLTAIVALGFLSCSSGDDSSGSGTTASIGNSGANASSSEGSADYSGRIFGMATILHLKADKTYVMEWAGSPKERGTYTLTGDFTNGTLILHMKEKRDTLSGEWKANVEDETITITDGTFKEMGNTFTKTN